MRTAWRSAAVYTSRNFLCQLWPPQWKMGCSVCSKTLQVLQWVLEPKLLHTVLTNLIYSIFRGLLRQTQPFHWGIQSSWWVLIYYQLSTLFINIWLFLETPLLHIDLVREGWIVPNPPSTASPCRSGSSTSAYEFCLPLFCLQYLCLLIFIDPSNSRASVLASGIRKRLRTGTTTAHRLGGEFFGYTIFRWNADYLQHWQ